MTSLSPRTVLTMPNTKKPEELLRKWLELVNKSDIDGLLAMYDERAVLLPTFSNRMLMTPAAIREYFERLCSREDLSCALHEKTLRIQPVENDSYSVCGIYAWRFALEGELLTFEARFSYFLDFSLPAPIVHHHSSQIPRML